LVCEIKTQSHNIRNRKIEQNQQRSNANTNNITTFIWTALVALAGPKNTTNGIPIQIHNQNVCTFSNIILGPIGNKIESCFLEVHSMSFSERVKPGSQNRSKPKRARHHRNKPGKVKATTSETPAMELDRVNITQEGGAESVGC
jgi:hypothetical protein